MTTEPGTERGARPGARRGPHRGTLYAASDLHVTHPENRALVEAMVPRSADDCLIVAGDVGDYFADVRWALETLRARFSTVLWTPGNHELWTRPGDPVALRGEERYRALVEMCRAIDVRTPEDDYLLWEGIGGPVLIAPLFLLYDYSFRVPGVTTKAQSLQHAYDAGIVCTDEALLHPDPHASREEWCWARVAATEKRLAATDPALRTVLVNHYPLVREPTRILRYPDFAQWCGTERTADWHRRFRAVVAVCGHLHVPRTTWYDGVRFKEVSVGYPAEWRRRGAPPQPMKPVLTTADTTG